MSQHIGPRTISAQGGSIKRVGNYRIHTFPSELVTDGLALNLDAGDPRSYPSSGTTWTDLSGNGNNGTLVNGPTYSNAAGGALVFDGTDDYITTNYRFPTGNLPKSFSVWFKINSTTDRGWIVAGGSDTSSQAFGLFRGGGGADLLFHGNGAAFDMTFNVAQNTTDWYNVTISYDGSVVSGYVNGQLDVTKSVALATSSATVHLGRRKNATDPFEGNISVFQVYNRALSAAEVAQNYDALRVRYGTYTNTFTPICAGGEGKVEVLCVAGGGGGSSGGGGAGGLIYNSAFAVNSNSGIGLTVGAGGTSGNCDAGAGSAALSGQNSVFGSLTSIGGGNGGQGGGTQEGGGGGSGGGAAANGGAENNGGSGTSGQGNAGGGNGGFTTSPYGVGGGGGAGAAGITATSARAFPGGNGLTYSISGSSTTYAGGGGGGAYSGSLFGAGGSGGAGDGAANGGLGSSAIPNTGSGGGGGSANQLGGNGSNGIVIVRYPATDYNVEVLVVAGGGGGGRESVQPNNYGGAGGGGGGGLIYVSSTPVSSGKKYLIDVGAGGAGSTTNAVNGANGKNSKFEGLVAIGGGGGGGWKQTGSSGGSGGGGGSSDNSTTYYGGSGTPGQGNDGGYNWFVFNLYSMGGGGGGAGGPGATDPPAVAADGMAGGDGLSYSISGTSVTYAAGGRGSYGQSTTALGGVDGSANTGNGGGGGSYRDGGDGGSGIVIIAYKGPQRGIGGTIDTTSRPGYTLHKFTTTGTDFFIP